MIEVTFVQPETSAEVYVDIDEETGDILDLYTDRASDWLYGRTGYTPGRNPLFLHASTPAQEFHALLDAGYVHGEDSDLISFEEAREIAADWHAPGDRYFALSTAGYILPGLQADIEQDIRNHYTQAVRLRRLLLFIRVFGPAQGNAVSLPFPATEES